MSSEIRFDGLACRFTNVDENEVELETCDVVWNGSEIAQLSLFTRARYDLKAFARNELPPEVYQNIGRLIAHRLTVQNPTLTKHFEATFEEDPPE